MSSSESKSLQASSTHPSESRARAVQGQSKDTPRTKNGVQKQPKAPLGRPRDPPRTKKVPKLRSGRLSKDPKLIQKHIEQNQKIIPNFITNLLKSEPKQKIYNMYIHMYIKMNSKTTFAFGTFLLASAVPVRSRRHSRCRRPLPLPALKLVMKPHL